MRLKTCLAKFEVMTLVIRDRILKITAICSVAIWVIQLLTRCIVSKDLQYKDVVFYVLRDSCVHFRLQEFHSVVVTLTYTRPGSDFVLFCSGYLKLSVM